MTLKLTCKRYVYIRLSFRERLSFFSTLASWKSLLCSANINFTGVKSIQSFSASFCSPCVSVAGGATASQTLSQVRRPTLEERPENRACSNKHVSRTGGGRDMADRLGFTLRPDRSHPLLRKPVCSVDAQASAGPSVRPALYRRRAVGVPLSLLFREKIPKKSMETGTDQTILVR